MKRLAAAWFLALVGTAIAQLTAEEENANQLSVSEKKAGFELLFDGRTLDGWKHNGNWTVTEGAITRTDRGGSLVYVTRKVPDDFELRFQWRVAKGSNSGVYYRPGQYEYQILDNQVHVDGKNPRTSAASLYFCMAPSHDATREVGEWNDGRVICKGTTVQHWLNGVMVINFDYSDPRWAFNVKLLKLRGAELAARGANLFFQDHGDPVWYRGVKMRALRKEDALDMTTIQPAKIAPKVLEAERKKLEGILERRKAQKK